MTERTVKDLKDEIRDINAKDPEAKLPVTGTKAVLAQSIQIYHMTKYADAERNRATTGLKDAVKQFEKEDRKSPLGTTRVGSAKCKVITFGKDHAETKQAVFNALDDDKIQDTKATRRRPKGSIGVTHAIIRATEVKGESDASGNAMLTSVLASSIIDPDLARLSLGALRPTSESIDNGLFKASDVDALVKDLQSRMPEGWVTVDYISNDEKEFKEFILYDVTEAPEKGPRYPPSGIFKVEVSLRKEKAQKGRRARQVHLVENPTSYMMLEASFGRYLNTQKDGMPGPARLAEQLAYRVTVLSRFNLIPFATPYNQEVREVKGFSGKESRNITLFDHGINRHDGIMDILFCRNGNEHFSFDTAIKVIQACLRDSPIEFKCHQSNLLPYSESLKAIRAAQFEYRAASKAVKSDKKAKRMRRPSNKLTLTPDNVSDLKRDIFLINLFLEVVANQAPTTSIMNMLAQEERQAGAGVLPNVCYMLRSAKKDMNAADSATVKALLRLQNIAVFRPFGWVFGIVGKSDKVKSTNQKPTPMDGRYGSNECHLRPVVSMIGNKPTIGLEAVPYSEGALATRIKHSKPRTPRR